MNWMGIHLRILQVVLGLRLPVQTTASLPNDAVLRVSGESHQTYFLSSSWLIGKLVLCGLSCRSKHDVWLVGGGH